MGKVMNVRGTLCYLHHIDVDKERVLRERLEYALRKGNDRKWVLLLKEYVDYITKREVRV